MAAPASGAILGGPSGSNQRRPEAGKPAPNGRTHGSSYVPEPWTDEASGAVLRSAGRLADNQPSSHAIAVERKLLPSADSCVATLFSHALTAANGSVNSEPCPAGSLRTGKSDCRPGALAPAPMSTALARPAVPKALLNERTSSASINCSNSATERPSAAGLVTSNPLGNGNLMVPGCKTPAGVVTVSPSIEAWNTGAVPGTISSAAVTAETCTSSPAIDAIAPGVIAAIAWWPPSKRTWLEPLAGRSAESNSVVQVTCEPVPFAAS